MLHHLAGATIQVANLDNYNCHPQEDGKKKDSGPFLQEKTHPNILYDDLWQANKKQIPNRLNPAETKLPYCVSH